MPASKRGFSRARLRKEILADIRTAYLLEGRESLLPIIYLPDNLP
jgi:hypothetical protein